MKRVLPVFVILLSVSSVYSADGNADVPKVLRQYKTMSIIQESEKQQEENRCEIFIQPRRVGQICVPDIGEKNKENNQIKILNTQNTRNLIALENSQNLKTLQVTSSSNTNNNVAKEIPEQSKGENSAGRNKDLNTVENKVIQENSQQIQTPTVLNSESTVQKAEKQSQNPKDLYAQALALYSDNSTDAALETFKLIPEYARTSTAWLLMGNILADMGKRDDAIFMYRKAIAVDKDNYKAYYNLGNMYLEDDIFYTAIDCYKEAVKAKITFPYAYYNLGIAYVKTGNLKKAKSAFLNALEYKKDVADFHYNLAYVYKLMNKPKLAQTYLDNYNKLMGY